MELLLDTCVLIWAACAPHKLSKHTAELLEAPDSVIYVSAITTAELACGVNRGRIELSSHWKPWFRKCLDVNGWTCLPIDLNTMEEAYSLPTPFHQDPADRIIVATSRLRRLTLLTGDGKLLDYPHVTTAW